MSAPLYLAIDQGGHASRALVFDGAGGMVAHALREVGISHSGPERVEQHPDEILASIRAAVAEVLTGLGERQNRIVAAGLATQRSSIVCWDRRNGAPLSPVISWQDRRESGWLDRLKDKEQIIHRATGLMLSPHYGANKLRWCFEHLPAVRSAYDRGALAWGPLASFIAHALLIERPHYIDPANAARTQLWNLESGQWDPNLLQWFGLPAEPLPACVPTCHNYGRLRVNGIDLPLKLMTGDQSAALYAYGRPRADTAYVNIGSGAFVQRPVGSAPIFTQRLLSSIVMRDREQASYVLEGTVNGAATALDWLTEEVGLTDWQQQLPQWLAQDSMPPLFLNGVSGLAAPFWVPGFRSRFIGTGEAWEQAVAVVESIVFLLQANMEEMRIVLPAPERILATGGLAGLDGLCRRLAALSGRPVYRPATHEATARGSAYILAESPDHWPELEPGQWFHPQNDPALTARYRQWTEALMTALAKES